MNVFLDATLDDSGGRVTAACDAACQVIRDYLHQTINLVRDDIVTLHGRGREMVILPQLPVVDVTSVFEDEDELIEDDDYVWDDAGIVYRRASVLSLAWSFGRNNVVITYDHGWAITDDDVVEPNSGDEPVVELVPSDIRMVAKALAARMLRAGNVSVAAGSGGIVKETIGDYSYELDSASASAERSLDLLDVEKAALDRYKPGTP